MVQQLRVNTEGAVPLRLILANRNSSFRRYKLDITAIAIASALVVSGILLLIVDSLQKSKRVKR